MTREEPQGAQSVVLSDEHATVTISKHTTPNGSRLSIRPEEGPGCHLDALELESVTWQAEGFLDDLDDRRSHAPTAATQGDPSTIEPHTTLRIGNEYALVEVRAIEIDGADRLLVASVKMGYTIALGASELATLARQDPSFFSALLETPLGPEPDDLVEFH